MDPDSVLLDAFEAMVEDALESLPDWVLRVVSEIAVFVEDEQEESERQRGVLLLGLYRGVPRTTHYGRAPGTLPDTITLYRIPILEVCARLEDVPDRVRKVLVHEVGHAMGLAEGEPLRAWAGPDRCGTTGRWCWMLFCTCSSERGPPVSVVAWITTTDSFTARRSARQRPRTPSTARTTPTPRCAGRSSPRPGRECSTSAPGRES